MEQILISFLIFILAILYASVGHGGASGYLAILTLFGFAIVDIKSSALLLNIVVSSVAFYQYYKGGHFRWKLFFPFAIVSVPMAFVGSLITIDPKLYKQILGICLLFAVLRISGVLGKSKEKNFTSIPLAISLLIGAILGLVSGMIGIGGGIILTPIILLFSWANLKETAAVSALFILVNSISGIIGVLSQEVIFNKFIFVWIACGFVGGFLGAFWGSKKALNKSLKFTLAFVLFFASIKLIFI